MLHDKPLYFCETVWIPDTMFSTTMRCWCFVLLLAQIYVFSQGVNSLVDVPGRIVVEPKYPSTLGDIFTLTLVNSQGATVASIILRENIKKSTFGTGRNGAVSGDFLLRPDGTFLLSLPPGDHRLLVRRQPGPGAPAYYVKSVQAGSVDLLDKLLVVRSPFTGEIVITLAKCAPETPLQCK